MQQNKAGSKTALGEGSYPVQFSVEYPESSNRLTVLAAAHSGPIPIVVVMELVSGDLGYPRRIRKFVGCISSVRMAMFWIAPLLVIVFRQKYPLWWFETFLELYRFNTRVTIYLMLMRDEYPSLDEQQAVSLQIEYPDVEGQLNRFLPIIKWLLATPHLIVLIILWIAVVIVTYRRLVYNPDCRPVSKGTVHIRRRDDSLVV